MRYISLILAFAALLQASAQAAPPDSEAFVAAFGEVCIPERLSYKGTLALAEDLGWRHVVPGENADYDRFIAYSDALLAGEVAEDPDLIEETGNAWFTREIGGRPHLLAVSYQLSQYLDALGCYLYDFAATAPIDPEPVTRLLSQPIAHTTDGGDPFYAVDPAVLVTTVWGPSPRLPRTLDTYLTFIPQGSEVAAQTGFTGLMLKFSTSLPDREEWQE
ncbi:hypothetical protein [Paracoccus sp. SSJ]|uniref:hypothetical protein n=1 Tax=Paracoccus sp. SSJ TaxID=3050636 RepID=UPI00254FA995|nr:hypothetical protein [Paracoccus sp. SSJ]MDK8874223.1 hypothetical protein [Paracoccus sp. SSJ]